MKVSSQLAIGALIGRKIGKVIYKAITGRDAPTEWADYALMSVLAKNELLDPDEEEEEKDEMEIRRELLMKKLGIKNEDEEVEEDEEMVEYEEEEEENEEE